MLTYTEANDAIASNNGKMPSWMYINLKNTGDNNTIGYWLSAADANVSYGAYYVNSTGNIYSHLLVNETNDSGLRPVITLTK